MDLVLPGAGGSASFSVLGLAIPAHLMPFGSLALTQVLIPKASFVGHVAGIVVGYAVGFGAFAWMNIWWTLCLAAWAIVGASSLYTISRLCAGIFQNEWHPDDSLIL